ncbi:polyribonucleotide nucleotidyltransferase [Pseudomonas sp. DTU_2021_1001937_2_SI_NGA_ILE_001]|uniref:polyribonucleotide nucleotidyltransferase n=1 Tax=Pseudomonas sp. DTU_2021_1001937_2_SI_NGA_ILE_001 TaxID=3077589 RepID=UPI0028FC0D0B|nr:polyribonucleotide nucleotidyltransferase [Pseudomonas sp. DTU_2021_1001937_2_SI_NGA_ILE_001]WNW13775.1 polyribonucleotide nucleotidyltransferase [Pseudomonas sp. DTU_2021_1001937_2_SI_NGA_ILE_001]
MPTPRRSVLIALALSATLLLPGLAQAEKRHAPAKGGPTVSLLSGKLKFSLPTGYVKGEMPEIDAKAKAEGVSGAMYSLQAEQRVLIVTQTPNPTGVEAADNDTQVLDELSAAALSQQGNSYQQFQKTGERRVLKKNGLGIRQFDAEATLGGAKVLTTTLVAASGNRSAVLNLISSARDPAGHAKLLARVIGR